MAASITHPLDLTKVRLQTSGDKGMIGSLRKTVANNGMPREPPSPSPPDSHLSRLSTWNA